MAAPDLDTARQLVITLTDYDNSNITFTVGDFDAFDMYNVQICINYASQLGASLMLLVVMIILTDSKRRKTWMFGLNALALLFNFFRMLFLCLYFTTAWNETYVYFTGDYDLVPSSAFGISNFGAATTLLVLICVEICLVLQTQVVLITLPKRYRLSILGSSILVATLTLALRVVYTVYNIRAINSATPDSSFDSLTNVMSDVTVISICWFSVVFTGKLGHAIYQRRKLGIQSFGPMEILFVMGGQTMVVPAIVAIIAYATEIPSMDSHIVTITAIFLPLSSLWANAVVDNRRSAADISPNAGSGLAASSDFGSGGSKSKLLQVFKKPFASITSSRRTSLPKEWNNSNSASPVKPTSTEPTNYLADLEKQGY